MRVAIYTLGCRLNQAESAAVADDLTRHGYTIVSFGEPCDIVIVNSCSVTATAAHKTRQTVRGIRRKQPGAFVVVIGCDATVADPASYPEANLIVPNPRTQPLSAILTEPLMTRSATGQPLKLPQGTRPEGFTCEGTGLFSERTRANLKVQDGCSFFCSYCIVPHTRGPARSRDMQDILREAKELIARGHNELVLTGVNVTTYHNSGADLADLMEELLNLGGDFRLRLGSAEPGAVVPKIVQLMAKTPRVCRFLHLPLQHGDNAVLQAMKRHYSAEHFRDLVLHAAETIPNICFGTDVIAGFPTETDETFDSSFKLIQSLPFGLMHVFTYSPRPGTPAAALPNRPKKCIAEKRSAALLELASQKAETFAKQQIGKTLQVLVEEESIPSGWSDNYLEVAISNSTPLPANTLCNVVVDEHCGGRSLKGHLVP